MVLATQMATMAIKTVIMVIIFTLIITIVSLCNIRILTPITFLGTAHPSIIRLYLQSIYHFHHLFIFSDQKQTLEQKTIIGIIAKHRLVTTQMSRNAKLNGLKFRLSQLNNRFEGNTGAEKLGVLLLLEKHETNFGNSEYKIY